MFKKENIDLSIDQNRVELAKLLLVFDLNTAENILTKINQNNSGIKKQKYKSSGWVQ